MVERASDESQWIRSGLPLLDIRHHLFGFGGFHPSLRRTTPRRCLEAGNGCKLIRRFPAAHPQGRDCSLRTANFGVAADFSPISVLKDSPAEVPKEYTIISLAFGNVSCRWHLRPTTIESFAFKVGSSINVTSPNEPYIHQSTEERLSRETECLLDLALWANSSRPCPRFTAAKPTALVD